MDRLILLSVVMILGYYIMTEPTLGNGCFNWCDVGKGLFGLSLTTIATLIVKGPVPSVLVVN